MTLSVSSRETDTNSLFEDSTSNGRSLSTNMEVLLREVDPSEYSESR